MEITVEVPVVASVYDTGLVLDICAVDIEKPAITGQPYLRLTDGSVFRIPDPLVHWALDLLGQQQRRADPRPMFPCQVDLGVLDGRMFAEVM